MNLEAAKSGAQGGGRVYEMRFIHLTKIKNGNRKNRVFIHYMNLSISFNIICISLKSRDTCIFQFEKVNNNIL